jgi:hypothetical protein
MYLKNFIKNYKYTLPLIIQNIISQNAAAQAVNDVFGEVENKGNILVSWLTSGFFAFAIVALALMFVIVSFLQGKMEWTRALTIVISSILIGQIPNIAAWLIH